MGVSSINNLSKYHICGLSHRGDDTLLEIGDSAVGSDGDGAQKEMYEGKSSSPFGGMLDFVKA